MSRRYDRDMTGSTIPRVAITGIGVVSPFGVGRDCFWRHVRRGCSGTRAVADLDASAYPCRVAAPAASEAWQDAGLRLNEPNAGVLVGSGAGGIDVAERQYGEFFNDGWKRVTPYAIPVSIVGMISSEISIALELHGISHVVSTGCTSPTA